MKIKNGRTEKKVYWDLTNLPVNFDFTEKQAVQQRIRQLLLQSVKRRLVSDVPVGAFLSGGIDSSVVAGLMGEATDCQAQYFQHRVDEKRI